MAGHELPTVGWVTAPKSSEKLPSGALGVGKLPRVVRLPSIREGEVSFEYGLALRRVGTAWVLNSAPLVTIIREGLSDDEAQDIALDCPNARMATRKLLEQMALGRGHRGWFHDYQGRAVEIFGGWEPGLVQRRVRHQLRRLGRLEESAAADWEVPNRWAMANYEAIATAAWLELEP